jgi:hypothetical protein
MMLTIGVAAALFSSTGFAAPNKTPGRYRAKIKPDMAGDWIAKLSFNGPHEIGQTSFNLNVKE